jgi:hypothetical protein
VLHDAFVTTVVHGDEARLGTAALLGSPPSAARTMGSIS